jgi:hypothetical protein
MLAMIEWCRMPSSMATVTTLLAKGLFKLLKGQVAVRKKLKPRKRERTR